MYIKLKRLIIGAAALFLLSSTARGAFEYSGRSAREEGMAGANVALAGSAAGVFHNPAGLAYMERPHIVTGYSGLFMGLDDGRITNSIISGGFPLNRQYVDTVAGGWSRLQVDDLYTEDSFTVAAASKLREDFSVGASLKNLTVSYGEDEYTKINPVFDSGYRKSAFSMDIGALYRPSLFSFALAFSDINRPDVGLKHSNRVPAMIKIGASRICEVSSIALQLEHREGDTTIMTGGERELFTEHLLLRAGFRTGSRYHRIITAGFTVRSDRYRMDYAFNYPLVGIRDTLGTHKVNFSFYFTD